MPFSPRSSGNSACILFTLSLTKAIFMMDYEMYHYKYGNVKHRYSHNRQEIDLHREEEGRGNKPMETRQTSHTANFSA